MCQKTSFFECVETFRFECAPFGRMAYKAGSLRAQQQQRRAQCSWQGQRAATLSPHSARTDATCTHKQTPPISVRARIAPVVASFAVVYTFASNASNTLTNEVSYTFF